MQSIPNIFFERAIIELVQIFDKKTAKFLVKNFTGEKKEKIIQTINKKLCSKLDYLKLSSKKCQCIKYFKVF